MSLVCIDEHELLTNIEKLIKKDIHKFVVKGFAADPSIKAEPIQNGGGGRGRGGSGKSSGGSNRSSKSTNRSRR
jgi:ATP-dependent RNA helicase RhlE